MTRPSSHSDKLLIEAARQMFPDTGCSRLSLHQVAKKAGVNLGMFHYYFKTKDVFIRKVLQNFYEDFFENFKLESTPGQSPLADLRDLLVKLSGFVRDNQSFMSALLVDLLNGEPVAIKFARDNFARHAGVLYALVRRCQKAGLIENLPPEQILAFMMPGLFFPFLAAGRISRLPALAGKIPKGHFQAMTSDGAIKKRIDMALKAVSKTQRRTK